MKKTLLITLSVVFLGILLFIPTQEAHASESQSAGKVTYTSDKEGFIRFDSEGTIIESNLPKNEKQNKRATLNYSTGRWVYFSKLTNWGRNKVGNSNHTSYKYRSHGSKVRVGGLPKSARGGLNSWSFASTTGPRKATFEAWYKPNGSY